MLHSFEKSLEGKERLLVVFWLWGIAGNGSFIFLYFLLSKFFLGDIEAEFIWPIIFIPLQMAYFIVSQIMIWRSAFNISKNRKWGHIARFFVINSPLIFIIMIFLEYFFLSGLGEKLEKTI